MQATTVYVGDALFVVWDHGAPGLTPDYGETYDAAFLLSPEGNNVETVNL